MLKLRKKLVLLTPFKAEETWEGGVIVKTDAAKTPQMKGTVKAIGPEVKEVAVGDVVIYGKFSFQEIEDDILISEDDVLAVEIKEAV